MRRLLSSILGLSVVMGGVNGRAVGQACTATTGTITGTVYAPNGTDPLPNVTVYIPTTAVAAFTPGVSCPLVGAAPSGVPLVGTVTDVQGHFELDNVPAGTSVPLVIVSGRWRRQLVIPTVTACQVNPLPSNYAVMPKNQSEGDIPKIAIATGAVDQVECVLHKMGISDSEFTDPTGSGRINLFLGSAAPGARIDAQTPTQASLMGDPAVLNQYDVLMLPCQGTPANNYAGTFSASNPAGTPSALGAQELANFVAFANAGGRVYSSHYSYAWMFKNAPFDTVANWLGSAGLSGVAPDPGTATVNTTFTAGKTLATWLQNVGATATLGQMTLATLRKDTSGVNPPTQAWLALNNAAAGDPVMQFVFDTPVAPPGQTINQCGRVLYNEYHVENGASSPAKSFPTECTAGTGMTAQEKLLEYMLFELTDDGGQPTLDPTTQDFGAQAIGLSSAPFTFTWTNNSSFASQVTSTAITGDFAVTSNSCTNATVAGGASCQINVVFTPTALGARLGTLTVVAQGNSLTSSLTGTGTPGFILSGTSLSYGNVDVGAAAAQTLTLTSIASQALMVPPFVTTGPFGVSTAGCPAQLAAGASCPVQVSFLPTVTGPLSGTVGANSTNPLYAGLNAAVTGTGVDFTISLNPTSGKVVAGDGISATATLTPLAGFAAPLTLTCVVQGGTAAMGCGLSATSVTLSGATTVMVNLTTTSRYTVIGYGGIGGRGYLWLVGLGTGCLLWWRRQGMSAALRSGLLMMLLAAVGLSLTGCTGKMPAQNGVYTGPGNYTVTVTATDVPAGGVLTHSATYTLTVTVK